MTAIENALEQVLSSLSVKFRGKEFMKIKIIKRAASKKIAEEIPAAENNQKTDTQKAIETVKLWIDDLRQKRERERLLLEEFFSREPCT